MNIDERGSFLKWYCWNGRITIKALTFPTNISMNCNEQTHTHTHTHTHTLILRLGLIRFLLYWSLNFAIYLCLHCIMETRRIMISNPNITKNTVKVNFIVVSIIIIHTSVNPFFKEKCILESTRRFLLEWWAFVLWSLGPFLDYFNCTLLLLPLYWNKVT